MKCSRSWLLTVTGSLLVGSVALAAPGEKSRATKEGQTQTRQTQSAQPSQSELKLPVELLDSARALAQSMQRVYIDPATGKLRPATPGEMREVARAAQALSATATAEPIPFALPAGGIGAVLPPELMSVSVARLDGDGGVVVDCAPDVAAAEQVLVAPVTVSIEEEK